jgi:polynucleotide 5'-hydroxyl-kinase GRC3/NOL9
VVLVIGPAEAGKTTFVARLANALHARGLRVAIVDADVGQSEIGPPATVGLGAVRRPLARTGDAEQVHLEFVGTTSPGRQPWRTAELTGRVAGRARAEFDRVLVDTSGFVTGGFAAAVKQRKIAAVSPDVVVAVQAADECEHILRALPAETAARVVRLPAVGGTRPRSAVARRRHREAALARHLEGARPIVLAAARVALHSLRGEPLTPAEVPVGVLVALHDARGDTVGLGVVTEVDAGAGTLTVRTTRAAREVKAVTVGEASASG